MKVLVVGGGGREHAIVLKLLEDKRISELHCAPGNGGISDNAITVNIPSTDVDALLKYSLDNKFDLVFVAPDDPLSMGLVDMLEENGIRAFGPYKKAAQLESSKAFSKDFMQRNGIPTAAYNVYSAAKDAIAHIEKCEYPVVIKADGLALGKGVIIAQNKQEALDAINDIMVKKVFGTSGNKVVIEEFISGPEMSVLAFCDGKTIVPMVSAQDHKKAYDNDVGLNTGGMGTFAPSPKYTPEIEKEFLEKIMYPTLNALNNEGIKYKGVLYFGLMLTDKGIKVLEYNARFGDPETQVVLPLLKTSLLEIINAIIDERLSEIKIEWEEKTCVCVVMASGGYPVSYKKGYEISFNNVDDDIIIYHAGTSKKDGKYLTSGGRVLGVVAKGMNIADARQKAYANVEKISFKDAHYRKDIGIK